MVLHMMVSRIFIVEDYDRLREMLTELLARSEGLAVCGSSASAEGALKQLEETQADLFVVDISLPGMNGFQLVKELQKRTPPIMCVVLSGNSSVQSAQLAQAAGAKAFVEKSNTYELPAILHRVLRGESQFLTD